MKIICIGDSLTHGYKVRDAEVWTYLIQDKLGSLVLNKGVIGDTTGGMLARFEKDVVGGSPTHVIIMGGTNDIIMEVPLGVIHANIAAMANQARANNIKPIIGIEMQTQPLMAQRYWNGLADFHWVNEGIAELRKRLLDFGRAFGIQTLDFYAEFERHAALQESMLDLYSDGVHPTVKGYEIMAKAVKI